MAGLIDEVGRRHGRLVVVKLADRRKGKAPLWLCKCDCGVTIKTDGSRLRSGDTKSCGCLKREALISVHSNNVTHNQRRKKPTPEYIAWTGMKTRCLNQNSSDYVNYGDRGITICEEWLESFDAFYWDMGRRPSRSYSIDRINCNGNYEPDNCRWATRRQQNNNRRTSRWIEFNGKRQTLADWARERSISPQCLLQRLRIWSLEDALTTPLGDLKVSERT